MKSPLFSDEGPAYYSAAFSHNAPFAKPGPYQTHLSPTEEQKFRKWLRDNPKVLFDPNASMVDYDMRGFWRAYDQGKAQIGREPDGTIGFTDEYKTPYDTTFSRESNYATGNCPFVWRGNQLIDLRDGTLIYDRGSGDEAPGKQDGGPMPGAAIWKGGKAFHFDAGGTPSSGTPNVPRYDPSGPETPSIDGGPVSVSEWSEMPSGIKKLAIRAWAVNACRAENVDERHWVPLLEQVVSRETGAPGQAGTGNPNIVNMWDSNAQKNIPSIGLAQVIQDNAPGQNLLDPVVNMRAAIRYMKSAYGDVSNVPEAQGIQAGYETGGSPDDTAVGPREGKSPSPPPHGGRALTPRKSGGPGWSDQGTTPWDMQQHEDESYSVPTGLRIGGTATVTHSDGTRQTIKIRRNNQNSYEAVDYVVRPGDTISMTKYRT